MILQEKPLPTCHAEVLHNTSVKLVPWHLYLRTRKIKRAKGARSTRVGVGGGERSEQEELPIPPLSEWAGVQFSRDSIRAFKDQINTRKHRAVNSLDGLCLVKYDETNWLKELTKYESVSSLHFIGTALYVWDWISFRLIIDYTTLSLSASRSSRTYPSSSGDHMMLGAMTIAILLAFILFTSLFSESFPRNVIKYLYRQGKERGIKRLLLLSLFLRRDPAVYCTSLCGVHETFVQKSK